LPEHIAQEFCALVRVAGEEARWAIDREALWSLFSNEYLVDDNYYVYVAHEVFKVGGRCSMQIALKVRYGGQGALLRAEGSDLIHAILSAVGWSLEVAPRDILWGRLPALPSTVAFAEILVHGRVTLFGVGVSGNRTTAMIVAVLSAINRALRRGLLDDGMKSAATWGSAVSAFR
jgi:2-isopropylmalate synthase